MSNTKAPIVLTPEQQTYRSEILTGLRGGICTVVFTKADGTERAMWCTLDQTIMPMQEAFKIAENEQDAVIAQTPRSIRLRSENNISVWDLEKAAWRSFNITSVIKWKQEY